MKEKLLIIGITLLCVAVLIFAGKPILDMFGVFKYQPPLNQKVENIVQIELVDSRNTEHVVLRTLTGVEMENFLDSFLKIKARRYVTDPPTEYGDFAVKVRYSDGCMDVIGEDMNRYYSSDGESMHVGWYYLPAGELAALFEMYVN